MDSLNTVFYPSPIGYLVFGDYICKTGDGGILLSGQIADTDYVASDMHLTRVDKLGVKQWSSAFGGSNWECAYSSIELPDASILTLGWTRSFGFGNNSNCDVLLVKWDSLGNKLWHKTFGSTKEEIGIGISSTKDGNYLLACTQYDPNTFIENPWIIKVDTGGNIIWQTKVQITGMCNPWWAKETSKGDIVSAGSCQNPNTQIDEGSIFLLDSVGNLKWERSFAQGNDHAYFRDVIETSDSGFICAGFCFEGASGGQDAWLVKLDSAGCDSAGCAIYTGLPGVAPLSNGEGPGVRLFPNPTKEIFYIKFPHQFFADTYTVTVTNMQGQVLHHQKYVYNLRQDMPIFVNNLASGMYLVTIKVEDKTYVKKLLIER
nr:T9SS type A sorting domain-containing protein [Bacteroidota bacterium]